jgi:hypothetical protein
MFTGYKKDIPAIEEFFANELHYRVLSGPKYQNLTKDKLFQRINKIQNFIRNNPDIDRLVVFVLTHGKKVGFNI